MRQVALKGRGLSLAAPDGRVKLSGVTPRYALTGFAVALSECDLMTNGPGLNRRF